MEQDSHFVTVGSPAGAGPLAEPSNWASLEEQAVGNVPAEVALPPLDSTVTFEPRRGRTGRERCFARLLLKPSSARQEDFPRLLVEALQLVAGGMEAAFPADPSIAYVVDSIETAPTSSLALRLQTVLRAIPEVHRHVQDLIPGEYDIVGELWIGTPINESPHESPESDTSIEESDSSDIQIGRATASQLLGKIALAHEHVDEAERRRQELIDEAREQKISWARIGESLGMSRHAAYRKFDQRAREADGARQKARWRERYGDGEPEATT